MLRIHFTFADLAGLRVTDRVDHGAEVVFSLHVLHTRARDLRFHRWRRATQRAEATVLLSQLYAPVLLPGYLCPPVNADWEGTVEGAMQSDPDVRRSSINLLAAYREITPFARALADDDDHARALLAKAIGAYQKTSIDTWMPQIDALVGTEQQGWARLAAAGPGQLLQNLHPMLTWKPPVLHLASALDRDIYLKGRGLLVQPTVFAVDKPWFGGIDADHLPAVLFVPLRRQPPLGDHEPAAPKSLIPLLGRTRATVLDVIAGEGPCSTGEIARRLDCSPTTVSDHTGVLRDSGLITTARNGQSVQHTVTDLGATLIRGRAT